jgi:hypothetical protein
LFVNVEPVMLTVAFVVPSACEPLQRVLNPKVTDME